MPALASAIRQWGPPAYEVCGQCPCRSARVPVSASAGQRVCDWAYAGQPDGAEPGPNGGSWLALKARLWPYGAAAVRFDLTPASPGATRVVMTEEVMEGPGRLLPSALESALLVPRNRETLDRLSDLAVRPVGDTIPGGRDQSG